MRLVVDAHIPFIRGAAEQLGEVTYLPGTDICADDVRTADALIIRTRTRCDERLLAGSSVQFIATATIGYDHLDTDYLQRAGIAWSNCPGCNATSVAQYVVAALLCLQEDGLLCLASTTVGIVGVGNVGTAVATAVERLGCRLLLCDPPRADRGEAGFLSLSEVAAQADVICLHTPLTTEGAHPTFHLLDISFFSSPFSQRPVLISAGRGEVVETQALKQALQTGKLRAAVLDVWENEPEIDRELLELAYFATPHIAGYSANGKVNGTQMALTAVAKHFHLPQTFSLTPPSLPDDFQYDPEQPSSLRALQYYSPRYDSRRLKVSPETFEEQRSHYPLRIEPSEA